MNSIKEFKETNFKSVITNGEYENAENMWEKFNIKNLAAYIKSYNETNVKF